MGNGDDVGRQIDIISQAADTISTQAFSKPKIEEIKEKKNDDEKKLSSYTTSWYVCNVWNEI